MGTTLPPFVSHCTELLSPLGSVRVRRMFGGWGFYVNDVFLALIAFERLYLKTNAHTQARFEQAQCEPFVFESKGKSLTMGYWTAPAEALDSPALMVPWARLALQAALQARSSAQSRPLKRVARPKKLPLAKATAKRARPRP